MHAIATETDRYHVRPIRTIHYPFINYSYLVVDHAAREALIVDPAWEWDIVHRTIVSEDIRLRAILLTHSHADHVNLVNPLLHAFQPQVYMSRIEIDRYGYRCGNLNALHDGDAVRIGETEIKALLTPGHTAGSLCYYSEGVVFTGDTIFTEGCGQCIGAGGSAEQMFDSIQRIRSLPPNTRVYPGHSFGAVPGQTLAEVIPQNIYFQIRNKDHFVSFRNRKLRAGANLAFK